MRRWGLAGPLAVVALLSGCGGGGPSPSARVSATVGRYYTAVSDGKYSAACQELAPALVTGMAQAASARIAGLAAFPLAALRPHPNIAACASLLGAIMSQGAVDARELRSVKVSQNQIQGKAAHIKLTGVPDESQIVLAIAPARLTLTDGASGWKIVTVGQ